MEKSGVGVIVATHGRLAEVLVETVEQILGSPSTLKPFTFKEDEAPKASFGRLENLIRKTERGRGVIILVDLFGGTPGSLALSMLDDAQVEVVTGVNLAMAITAATLDPEHGLQQASAAIVKAGNNSIKAAGRLLGE
jgi:PTS system mannose-specific IIA component